MARIRSVKPDFFRHEGLQDLEAANVGKYPMLVFEGLWGHCDKAGRFEWKPRMLKLDILPFLPFDMEETLNLLAGDGFIERYEVDGKVYGFIHTFQEHQRISGKEAQEPEKYPAPIEKKKGSKREATVKHQGEQEGKGIGREEEGKGKEVPPPGDTPPKFTDDDKLLACEILDGVKTAAPSANPNLDKWAETIRLMRERDKRSNEQIRAMFTWANTHAFWRTNILSPEKLREKWVTLEAQKNEKNFPRAGPQRPSTHSGFEQLDYSAGINPDGSF